MCLFPQFFFLSSVRLNQLLERQGGCVAEVDCFRPSQCEWKKVTTQNGWMLSCHLVMPRSLMGQFLPSPLTSRFCRNDQKVVVVQFSFIQRIAARNQVKSS